MESWRDCRYLKKGSQKLFEERESRKGYAVRVSESTVHKVVIYVGSVTSAQPLFHKTSKKKS